MLSLQGSFEVIMDRRLVQDDKRGLEQPIRDNKRTVNEVGRVLFDTLANACVGWCPRPLIQISFC